MEAKDLRIDNWLFSELTNSYFKVTVEDLVNIYYKRDENKVKPILLTEEILLKCGFEKCKFNTEIYYVSETLNLAQISFNNKNKTCYLDFEGTQTGVDIKYLHNLQNLFYALCQTELEINL